MELLNKEYINHLIDIALEEDVKDGDVTTNALIPESSMAVATMTAKAEGIIAGLPVARMVFEKLYPETIWTEHFKEGDKVNKGDVIVSIESTFRTLLTGERLALNFLQRMSGVATETNKYVTELEGFSTKLLDTRKTLPCFRLLDKYSVKTGGGKNHRIGLFDLAMIKDNHIKVAGGIANAVKQVRSSISSDIRIEVETSTLDEVKQALEAGADIIMLDNMSNDMMSEAVKIINSKAETEASGNMSIPRLKGVASTGVDFISVGALTHSVMALDISMNIQTK
ncbi:MAG: carboxylating nicotinate-nucleotide diphosphorylase [Marinifilaceae bacterium]